MKTKKVPGENSVFKQIQTKASLLKKKSATQDEFKVVVFESNKKKVENNKVNVIAKSGSQVDEKPEFDIKKARHEVLNFGLKGFENTEKEKAKVLMAIKLGAKPPKREYRNYKEILSEKKKIAEEQTSQQKGHIHGIGKSATGEALMNFKKFNKRKRKNDGDALKDYGKVTLSEDSSVPKKRRR